MRIFAEDERFLQLDVKKDGKGKVTMCTILDNAINKGIEQGIERGITQGENLKLIMGKNSGGFKSSNFDFFFDRNQYFQALTG